MKMTPTHEEGFSITGFSVRTQNKDEFNPNTARIPKLWQQFHTSNLQAKSQAGIFAVYTNYDSDANGFYNYTLGINSGENGEVKVEAGPYLIFQGKGPMPETVIEAWKKIWSFFENSKEYERNFISDYEVYSTADEVKIYIGIKP